MNQCHTKDALVAQLDRALPSEGRGQRFESSRVRQLLAKASILSDLKQYQYVKESWNLVNRHI